jgi:hypothetical protein
MRGVISGVLVWAFPAVAWACPVCFAARDEAERLALLATTVFLTSLPVLMIGGIIYWVVRRSSELDANMNAAGPSAEVEPQSSEAAEIVPLRRGA